MELRDPDEADPTGDRRHRLRWSNHSLSESPPTRQMTSLPSPVVSTPKTTTTAASPSADGSSSSLVLSPGCRSHSSPSALMGPDDAATLESDDTARKEGSPSMGVNDDEGARTGVQRHFLGPCWARGLREDHHGAALSLSLLRHRSLLRQRPAGHRITPSSASAAFSFSHQGSSSSIIDADEVQRRLQPTVLGSARWHPS